MGQCGSLQPTVVIWPLTVPAPKGLPLAHPPRPAHTRFAGWLRFITSDVSPPSLSLRPRKDLFGPQPCEVCILP